MENNLENKAKFFAQYWGQKVLHTRHLVNGNLIDLVFSKDTKEKYWLGLKPLSSITDEDAKSIASIISNSIRDSCTEELVDYHYSQIKKDPEVLCFASYETVDYMRSKGYALPWMGLSVEQLVEYGWIKLQDK